jgi:hypothetical protein
VFVYVVVLAAGELITVKPLPDVVDLSISNPVSLLELSVHARSILVEDAVVAVKLLGAAGVAAVVVAEASAVNDE